MTPEERMRQLDITLPPAPAPVGSYVPYVRAGQMVFTSGQLPTRDGKLVATGKIGSDLTIDQGAEAARVAALNALALIAQAAGSLPKVKQVVRLGVFVNSADGFTDQPKVANGASNLLVDIFGEAGKHARAAVGVNELPLNAPVELDLIVELAG